MYRHVLLNNGPRHSPPPDTSSTDAGSEPPDAPPTFSLATPLDELLYHPDVEVGGRGDIIQFYNKVFINFVKDFVLQFSPSDSEVSHLHPPLISQVEV